MEKVRALNHFVIFIFVFTILNTLSVFAGPSRTTYQAKIIKPDGYPLEATSVNFKFTILDMSGSCILYSETFSTVNMGSSAGLISFSLGTGVRTFPVSGSTFEQVFSNTTASLTCDSGGPATYSPSANDTRKIVMQFNDTNGWQTLPAMTINAVPYAMYANDSLKFSGKDITEFVQVASLPTCGVSEAMRFNGVGFSCIAAGGNGTVTSGSVITALGYAPADGASVTALTSNVSSVSSTVASVSSTVFSVSSTVTSLQSSVAASFAAITSSQWTTSGTNIFYNTGNIGIGTTTPVTKLDVSGGVRIGAESTTCAPALAGTLRYNASNVEYCNGTSWQAFGVSGAGITNFNGSTSGTQTFATGSGGTTPGFNTANGVHTLNIPLASTGSVTAGLISNADYTTFTNKITSSAASIAQVLGYVPADNAASGTYAQKANNLSDLTNVATARTNLGLGTFATASSIDLGSASATGTLAIARLPLFTGDATSTSGSNVLTLSDSGVTSGTYTKVTVDSKGRVTSGAQIASSDVTTALGYTPANSATTVSSQWSTSGTTINYMNGNVGIGTTLPEFKLSIEGDGGILAKGTYGTGATLTSSGAGTRLIWYPRKAAFRAGYVTGTQWDNANIGDNSIAMGWNSIAGGTNAVAMGNGNTANAVNGVVIGSGNSVMNTGAVAIGSSNVAFGDSSTAIGVGTRSNGVLSTSLGYTTTADSYSQITVGAYNMPKGSENTASWIATDPLFVIGNGTGAGASRSNAVMILKNGNVGIGTTAPTAQLHLAAGTSSTTALKFTSGTLLTSPQSGTMEYDGTNFYLTDSTNTRRAIAANTNPGTYDNVSNINSSSNITMTPTGSVIVSSTTASTNSNTGALVVKGGLGVAGDIYTSGTIVTSSNIQGVSVTATSGMISPYIYGSTVSGGALTLDSTTHSTKGNIYLAPNGGYVGLGTSAPTSLLHISGSGSYNNLQITSPNYSALTARGGSSSGWPLVQLQNQASGGKTWNIEAGRHSVDSFGVYDTVSGATRLLISSNGNVGIGTTGPQSKLQINTSFNEVNKPSGLEMFINGGNTNADVGKLMISPDGNMAVGGLMYINHQTAPSDRTVLNLGTTGFSGIPATMSLSNGNVGIGTTSPSAKFEVSGTSNFLDNVTIAAGRKLGIGVGPGSYSLKTDIGEFTTSVYTPQVLSLSGGLNFGSNGAGNKMVLDAIGNVGIGVTSPSAKLELASGTASLAPLKFTSGTLLSSAQSGSFEYDGFNFYVTDSTNTRRAIAANTNPGTYDNVSNINSSGNITLTPTGSVVVSSTTASTNSSNGALVVKGGLGVAGDIYTSGTIVTSSNIQGVSVTATSGMISPYIYGSTLANGNLRLESTTNNTKGYVLLASQGGNVGVGVTSTNYPLQVSGTAHIDSLRIGFSAGTNFLMSYNSTSTLSNAAWGWSLRDNFNNADKIFVERQSDGGDIIFGNGNVGIGTSSPTFRLDVAGDIGLKTNATYIYGKDTVGNNTRMLGMNSSNVLYVGDIDSRAAGVNVIATASDLNLIAQSANNVLINTSGTERVRVTAAGNVGIGTTSPTNKLHVIGGNIIGDKAVGSVGSAGKVYSVADTAYYAIPALYAQTTGGAVGPLAINPGGGNVGIGTTSPASKLDVNGVVISSGFSFNGSEVGADTGLFEANDGLLQLKSNGAVVLHTKRGDNEGGYVGIGTSSPTEKLHVQGNSKVGDTASTGTVYMQLLGMHDTAGGSGFRLQFDRTNDIFGIAREWSGFQSPSFVIKRSDGNVGVGTSAPSAKLHIFGGDIYLTDQTINNYNTSRSAYTLRTDNITPASDNGVRLYDGNSQGHLHMGNLGGSYLQSYGTSSVSAGTLGTGTVDFDDNANFSSLLLNPLGGNVGIGTSAPTVKTHIYNQVDGPFTGLAIDNRKIYGAGTGVNETSRMIFSLSEPTVTNPTDRVMGYIEGGTQSETSSSDTFMAFGTRSGGPGTESEKMRINSAGYVGIGTASPGYNLTVSSGNAGGYTVISNRNTAAGGQDWRWYSSSTGAPLGTDAMCFGTGACLFTLYTTGNATLAGTLTQSSDARLKRDISSINHALDSITKIEGVTYYWKDNAKEQTKQMGLIAQNVETVFPEAVKTDTRGFKSVAYQNLVAPIINALREIRDWMFKTDDKIHLLEIDNAKLKQRNADLEAYLCTKDPTAPFCKKDEPMQK